MESVQLAVRPRAQGLIGSVPLPADPDLVERALLFAALGVGKSLVRLPRPPANLKGVLTTLSMLGVQVNQQAGGAVEIKGCGLRGFSAPAERLDVAGAPVLAIGLLGCLSAQAFASEVGPFDTHEALGTLLDSLQRRGANISLQQHYCRVGPATGPLSAQEVRFAAPAALGKHLCLISGLFASGPTVVSEPLVSVDHTERMLDGLGLSVTQLGSSVQLNGPIQDAAIEGFEFATPGSVAAAAYLLAAAALTPKSQVTVRDACLNPTRAGFHDGLRALGVQVSLAVKGQTLGEPYGDVATQGGGLRGGKIGGELSHRLSHEVPALAAVAACATGDTEFSDLGSVMPEGHIAKIVGFLRSFGVEAQGAQDSFWIRGSGGAPLTATRVTTGGDPHLAALGILLGLAADGESVIDDVLSLAEFLPRFVGTLSALGAELKVLQ
jgi:3-phosphoshikimate 1-carboxyvinyltransferase